MENEGAAFHHHPPNLRANSPSSSTLAPSLPLSMVRAGQTVQVKTITGKDETRRFLSNLGFVEGAEIRIVSEMNGNVIVNVMDTRVAISKAMASRVLTV